MSSLLEPTLGLSFVVAVRASAAQSRPAQLVAAASTGCSGTRSGKAATGTGATTAAGARAACEGAAGCAGAVEVSGAGCGAEACRTGRNGNGGDPGCGGARGGRAAALGKRLHVSSRLVGALLLWPPLAAARVLLPPPALLSACPLPARLPPNCQPAAFSVPLTAAPRAPPAAAAGGGGNGLTRRWLLAPPHPALNPRNPPPL